MAILEIVIISYIAKRNNECSFTDIDSFKECKRHFLMWMQQKAERCIFSKVECPQPCEDSLYMVFTQW